MRSNGNEPEMRFFGWFKGMRYSDCTDDFDEYRLLKNTIPKSSVIAHIKSLQPAYAPMLSYDIFTGERVTAGMYIDGAFRFPTDFLHYYQNYDIGIPYDYEEYLKSIGVGNEG